MSDVNINKQDISQDSYYMDPNIDPNAGATGTTQIGKVAHQKFQDAISTTTTTGVDTIANLNIQGSTRPVLSSEIEESAKTTSSNPNVLEAAKTVAETMNLDQIKANPSGAGMPSITFMKKLQEVILALEKEFKKIDADQKEIQAPDPKKEEALKAAALNTSLSVVSGQTPGGQEGQVVTVQSQLDLLHQLCQYLVQGFGKGKPIASLASTLRSKSLISQINNLMQKLGLVKWKLKTDEFAMARNHYLNVAYNARADRINMTLFNQQFNYAALKAASIAAPFVATNPDAQELTKLATSVSLAFSGKPTSEYLNAILQDEVLLQDLQEAGLLPRDKSQITDELVQGLPQNIQSRLTEIASVTKLTAGDNLNVEDPPHVSEFKASATVAEAFKPNQDAVNATLTQEIKDILTNSGLSDAAKGALLELFQNSIFIGLTQNEINRTGPTSSRESALLDYLKSLNVDNKSELSSSLISSSIGDIGSEANNGALNSVVGLLLVTVQVSVLFSSLNEKNPESPTMSDFLKDHPDLSPTMQTLVKLSTMSDEDIDTKDLSTTLQNLNINPSQVSADPESTEILRATLKMLKQILANLMAGGVIPAALAHASSDISDTFSDDDVLQMGNSTAA